MNATPKTLLPADDLIGNPRSTLLKLGLERLPECSSEDCNKCLLWLWMIHPSENNHPAGLLFELVLREIRSAVQHEFTLLRQDFKKSTDTKPIRSSTKRLYSLKEAAVELSMSELTVRRLINRGLLRPNRAIRHLRIPREQLDEFARNV